MSSSILGPLSSKAKVSKRTDAPNDIPEKEEESSYARRRRDGLSRVAPYQRESLRNPFATNSVLRAVYMRRELIVSKIEFGYL